MVPITTSILQAPARPTAAFPPDVVGSVAGPVAF
jgi:hypothetical protein